MCESNSSVTWPRPGWDARHKGLAEMEAGTLPGEEWGADWDAGPWLDSGDSERNLIAG